MENPDYEATSTLPNDHALLRDNMYLDPKGMEDPDYEATATLPNDYSLLQYYM
jgi:hypothetical protein